MSCVCLSLCCCARRSAVHVTQLSLCVFCRCVSVVCACPSALRVQSAVFRDKDKLYKELALAEKEELRVQEKNQIERLAKAGYDPESPTYLDDDDGTLPPSVFEQPRMVRLHKG